MLNLTACFVAISTAVFSTHALAAVWETKNQWSMEAEARFSDFIKSTPMDVFKNSTSDLNGISTDCADAVYSLRIYFAFKNGLPVKFQNKVELSNETSAFDGQAAGLPRVKAFINHVNRMTSTSTLPWDTAPIVVNRQMLRPGAMYLNTENSREPSVTYRAGHVYYLSEVRDNGLMIYFSSTVPKMVRVLSKRWTIEHAPRDEKSGYRVWKWPVGTNQPGLSAEQFSFAQWMPNKLDDYRLALNWQESVQKRIRSRLITADEKFIAMRENVKEAIIERAEVVDAGWRRFQSGYGGAKCLSESEYDSYSTPSRDVKIQTHLENFRRAAKKKLMAEGRDYADDSWDFKKLLDSAQFQVMPGRIVNYSHLMYTFWSDHALEISEPEHSPEVRWGFRKQGRWICPARRSQYKGHETVPH